MPSTHVSPVPQQSCPQQTPEAQSASSSQVPPASTEPGTASQVPSTHVSPEGQVLVQLPQGEIISPHSRCEQSGGSQTHSPSTQLSPAPLQVPHSMVPPQPSGTGPHWPGWQVVREHLSQVPLTHVSPPTQQV